MTLPPIEPTELKDLGVDLSLLGWSDAELSELLAPPGIEGVVDADDTPAPPKAAGATPSSWRLAAIGSGRDMTESHFRLRNSPLEGALAKSNCTIAIQINGGCAGRK
jgi:hypothetical protein